MILPEIIRAYLVLRVWLFWVPLLFISEYSPSKVTIQTSGGFNNQVTTQILLSFIIRECSRFFKTPKKKNTFKIFLKSKEYTSKVTSSHLFVRQLASSDCLDMHCQYGNQHMTIEHFKHAQYKSKLAVSITYTLKKNNKMSF